METSSFGLYLRKLRCSHMPSMTQEELAKAVGRTKMTISQFEKEKNAPPQGELLDKIIVALDLSDDEENTLRFLAAEQRRKIPGDIEEYFFTHPYVCKAIRFAQKVNMSNEDWEILINLMDK